MKILYTNEPGVYGKFLNIQIVSHSYDSYFGGNFPKIFKVSWSGDRKTLIEEVFRAYKIKFSKSLGVASKEKEQ